MPPIVKLVGKVRMLDETTTLAIRFVEKRTTKLLDKVAIISERLVFPRIKLITSKELVELVKVPSCMEALVERVRPSEVRGGRLVSKKIEKRPSVCA